LTHCVERVYTDDQEVGTAPEVLVSLRWMTRVLAALLLGCVAPIAPIAHAADPPISFAGSVPLELTPEAASTSVQNDSNEGRRISVAVQFTSDPQGVSFQPIDLNLAPAATQLVTLQIADTAAVTSVSGSFVAVDQASGIVIRQPFKLAPAPTATKPAVTTINDPVTIGPLSAEADDDQLMPVPLEGSACKAPSAIQLAGPEDYATLTPACAVVNAETSELTLQLTELGPWKAGEYKGTLKVGDTDVDVTFTRSAPIWLFLLCVFAGVLVSLWTRSYIARRPLVRLKKAVTKLGKPAAKRPSTWAKDSGAARALKTAAATTGSSLSDTLDADELWGRRLKWVRFFLVPPIKATEIVDEQKKALEAAQATLASWNDETSEQVAELTIGGPPSRTARAAAIKRGAASAFKNPADSASRKGIAGIQDLIDEITALKSDQKSWAKLNRIGNRIPGSAPTADEPDIEATLIRVWVRCTIEHAALTQLVQREPATVKRSEDITTRIDALDLEVDRLAARTGTRETAAVTDLSNAYWQRAVGVSSSSTLRFPKVIELPSFVSRVLQDGQRVLSRSSQRLGELVFVMLAVFIVVVTALETLYFDEAWGTGWDVAFTIVAAAGGTLVLTPLLAALDQLSGAKSGADSA